MGITIERTLNIFVDIFAGAKVGISLQKMGENPSQQAVREVRQAL